MSIDRFLRDPVLSDFVLVVEGGARALVRRGYEGCGAAVGVGAGVGEAAGTVGGGRAPHPVHELGGGERAVLRAYRRGGLMRHLNRWRYFVGHRAFDELWVTEHAAASGVRVPKVLAAVERRAGLAYSACIATRWIAGAEELAGWLAGRGACDATAVLRDAGRQIGRMHAAGITHPDLNLRNLLVAPGDDGLVVYLLDFDRARRAVRALPERGRVRDLRRLARSARKLEAVIGADGWRALRDGYGPDWPASVPLG